MKYIEKVILKNFQSHKYTEVNFNKGLNVILGNSDSGKTSILRGIKWVLYNLPDGDSFITQGEKECAVKVIFNNKVAVTRIKSSSKNQYILSKPGEEDMVFSGFGRNVVPLEIVEATGMKQVSIDRRKDAIINISEQLDGPFLLNETSSVRAGAIGRLTGVNILDDALKNTVSDNNLLQRDYKKALEEKNKVEEEIIKFEYLKDKKILFEKLIGIQTALGEKNSYLNNLKSLKVSYDSIKDEKENLSKELERYKNLEKLENSYLKIENKIVKYNEFNNLKTQLSNNLREQKAHKEVLDLLVNVEKADKLESDLYTKVKALNELIEVSKNYKFVQLKLNSGVEYLDKFKGLNRSEAILETLLKDTKIKGAIEDIKRDKDLLNREIFTNKSLIKESEMEIDKATEEYKEILAHAKVCPTCFQKIDEGVLSNIKSKL